MEEPHFDHVLDCKVNIKWLLDCAVVLPLLSSQYLLHLSVGNISAF